VDYFRPDTLEEALEIAHGENPRIAAGCTDLFPATQRQCLDGAILDITGIPSLRGISRGDGVYRLGATTTWSDIVQADVPPMFDALKQAAVEVGAVQVQNSGTIAGNLCNASPAADGVPPLLVLDAAVELRAADGVRTIPLRDFITGPRQTSLRPSEIATAVTVPEEMAGTSNFQKLGAREHLVISIAMTAVRLDVDAGMVRDAAVAVGACSPVAVRLTAVEDALKGAPADHRLVQRVLEADVAAALSPVSDVRADAGYRCQAAGELIRRSINALLATGRAAA